MESHGSSDTNRDAGFQPLGDDQLPEDSEASDIPDFADTCQDPSDLTRLNPLEDTGSVSVPSDIQQAPTEPSCSAESVELSESCEVAETVDTPLGEFACSSVNNGAAKKSLQRRLGLVLQKLTFDDDDDGISSDEIKFIPNPVLGDGSPDVSADAAGNAGHYKSQDCIGLTIKEGHLLSCVKDANGTNNNTDESQHLTAFDISKEMEEVERYSYVSLVAHSLHLLFEYSKHNQSFQETCIKDLLTHLQLPQQMEPTMLLLTRGEAGIDCSDPFIHALKKRPLMLKYGPQIIVCDLLTVALQAGCFDARMRVLIKYLSLCLSVSWEKLMELEDITVNSFTDEQHEATEDEIKEKKQRDRRRKFKRYALIGLATVGGGAVIGLTGGLAAPLIAAGAGVIIGGAGAAALGTVAGVAIIGSLFGVAGAGLTGYKMNKRVGGLSEFEFEPLTCGRALHVTIAVTGWLSEKNHDFKAAWLGLYNSKEQYILRYESKYLRDLGQVLDYVVSTGVSVAVQQSLKHTILAGLMSAVMWPAALLSVASVIDNPWSVCTQRSVLAGKQLAEVLLSRQQGKRPVTLIGYSFGARVIFSCLLEMAKRKNCEGIVEEAILLGAPVTGSADEWRPLERVVAGRIVNGYCKSDWLLKFMYRTASVQFAVAGLSPVKWTHRIMQNMDLTHIVSGHFDYVKNIDEILDAVGIETKPHVQSGAADSLRQWADIQRSGRESSSSAADSPLTDSAVGDEVEEGVDAESFYASAVYY